MTHLDPFTIEIIKDALNAIGDEMFVSTAAHVEKPDHLRGSRLLLRDHR